jgi:hypothetical protein
MSSARVRSQYTIAVLAAAAAIVVIVLDIDGWPRYSTVLIVMSAWYALRAYTRSRSAPPSVD